MNVQAPYEGEIKALDFSSDVEEQHPITEVLIASSANKENINAAKEKELKDWSDNNVYSEVEDKDQHTISCRWVIETKKVNGLDIKPDSAHVVLRTKKLSIEELIHQPVQRKR